MDHMVHAVREAYGESELVAFLEAEPSVAGQFDLKPLLAAFRSGLPDPTQEGAKPVALRNSRSETAELLAQEVLGLLFGVAFPAKPQQGKVNANQPILGFDGWGLLRTPGQGPAFVLVNVKGTDEAVRPPSISAELAEECKRVPREPERLCRALAALQSLLKDQPAIRAEVVALLERLGRNELPQLVVAPVLVRGVVIADLADLSALRARTGDYDPPAHARGAVVSLGAALDAFGTTVLNRARAA